MADRLRNDSRVIESAHDQNTKTTFFKVIDASSTDHLPIIDVNVNVNVIKRMSIVYFIIQTHN